MIKHSHIRHFFALFLVFVMAFGVFYFVPENTASNAKTKNPTLSTKKKTLKAGAKFVLSVKNTKKKAKFSIASGKKSIKLKAVKKSKVTVVAVKKGNAKVQAKVSGKKLICKITVKSAKNAGKENKEPASSENASLSTATPVATPVPPETKDYKLDKVVVFSRHSIRAPMSGKGSVLDEITPYTWNEWSANKSELTTRGGVIETMMGQYFRKWLEKESLIPMNYIPKEGSKEVRFYANSKQRTLATAQYFSSGMLPVANVSIEHHADYDTMDPVFNPVLTFMSDSYKKAVEKQIEDTFKLGDPSSEKSQELKKGYEKLMEVIDFEKSESFKSGKITKFDSKDFAFTLKKDAEPAVSGSLSYGLSVSDALTLQYYEEPDAKKAAFGHDLSFDDWAVVSSVKDMHQDIFFRTPLLAINSAHPIVGEIQKELNESGRKFTFLCGHDSNISGILASLKAKTGKLPGTIESVPIGTKIVFEIWTGADGKKYAAVRLVYATTEQLRNISLIDEKNPPASYYLTFEGIEKNKDGMYAYSDLEALFDKADKAYDDLKKEYADGTAVVSPDKALVPAA